MNDALKVAVTQLADGNSSAFMDAVTADLKDRCVAGIKDSEESIKQSFNQQPDGEE